MYIWPDAQVQNDYKQYFAQTDEFLKLQNYQITQTKRKEEFQKLTERNIPVQMILENRLYASYQNYFKQMQEYFSGNALVSIQSDDPMGTTYVHTKMMVNEDGFRIQTANLTKASFKSNREHFYYGTDPEIRENLVKLFDTDRQGNGLKASDLHPNLVVCPVNCRSVIEALLSEAKESILIQTQYIVDPEILQILRHQSTKINVNLIVANTDENQDLIEYFGSDIARIFKKHYNHTKMILVDDKYLLLGSMNLSDNSLDNNREIWIILLNPDFISQFKDGFWADWQQSV